MQQMDINQLSPLSNDRSYLENFIAQLRATNSQSTTERGSRNKRSAPQYTYDIKNASESDKIRLQQAIAQWISENPEFLQQYGHHNKQGKVENGDLYQIDINQILTWIQIQKEKSTPAAPSPRPRNHNPYEVFLGSGSAAAGVIYPNQLSAIQYGIGYQQSDTPNGYGSQQYTAQTGSNNQQSSMQQMDINQLPPLSYDRTYVKKFIARLRATNSQSTSESGSRNEQSTSQQENLNQIPSDSGKTVVQRALEHLRFLVRLEPKSFRIHEFFLE
ncbi:conserved hypothetical protein [Cotesia vestalis bracovirus]|nr:conserved hypothetical protein [Cotesia vestalis bracovirus]